MVCAISKPWIWAWLVAELVSRQLPRTYTTPASSPALMPWLTAVPATRASSTTVLSAAAGEGRDQHSCSHAFWATSPTKHWCGVEPAQPSDINMAPGSILDQGRPLVFGGNRAPAAAEPHPDTALGSSTGQDLTMALGGITGHSHQAAPHHPQGSSSASSLCMHPSASLSLPSLHLRAHCK